MIDSSETFPWRSSGSHCILFFWSSFCATVSLFCTDLTYIFYFLLWTANKLTSPFPAFVFLRMPSLPKYRAWEFLLCNVGLWIYSDRDAAPWRCSYVFQIWAVIKDIVYMVWHFRNVPIRVSEGVPFSAPHISFVWSGHASTIKLTPWLSRSSDLAYPEI